MPCVWHKDQPRANVGKDFGGGGGGRRRTMQLGPCSLTMMRNIRRPCLGGVM